MIVNDAPAFGETLEDQREQAARLFLAHFQLPMAANDGTVPARRAGATIDWVKASTVPPLPVTVSVYACRPGQGRGLKGATVPFKEGNPPVP